MPSGVEWIGFELSVDDVIQSDPLPGDPGAGVRRGHQEHREGDQAQDHLDNQHRNTDALEVLLRWNHSHQLLEQTRIIC